MYSLLMFLILNQNHDGLKGIGRPLHKEAVSSYVLSDFSKEDHKWLDPLLPLLADEVHLLLTTSPEQYTSKVSNQYSVVRKQKER